MIGRYAVLASGIRHATFAQVRDGLLGFAQVLDGLADADRGP